MPTADLSNLSYWMTTRPYAAGEPLYGELEVDVAIVGGGFTGRIKTSILFDERNARERQLALVVLHGIGPSCEDQRQALLAGIEEDEDRPVPPGTAESSPGIYPGVQVTHPIQFFQSRRDD